MVNIIFIDVRTVVLKAATPVNDRVPNLTRFFFRKENQTSIFYLKTNVTEQVKKEAS